VSAVLEAWVMTLDVPSENAAKRRRLISTRKVLPGRWVNVEVRCDDGTIVRSLTDDQESF
jgi:hypothetical protein